MRIHIENVLNYTDAVVGVDVSAVRSWFAKALDAQKECQSVIEEGRLPWTLDAIEEGLTHWELRRSVTYLILAPSVIARNLKDIPTPYQILWVESIIQPCPTEFGMDGQEYEVIVLGGQPWIDVWLFANLKSLEGYPMTYCMGDATDSVAPDWLPETSRVLVQEGISDERFAVLSPLALSLVENRMDVLSAIRVANEKISNSECWENSSLLLSSFMCALLDKDLRHWNLVTDDPKQYPLLDWAKQSLERIYSGEDQRSELEQDQLYCDVSILGDEGSGTLMLRDRSVVLSFVSEDVYYENILLSKFWTRYHQWLSAEHVLNLSLFWKPNSIMHRIVFQVQWLHCCLLAVSMRERDPLAYTGADRWREWSTNSWNTLESKTE